MAYSRRNLLERIAEINDITIEHTNKGVSQEWVYKNIIRPRFYISKATYYSYMAINAKRDLEILKREDNRQKKLF